MKDYQFGMTWQWILYSASSSWIKSLHSRCEKYIQQQAERYKSQNAYLHQ